MATIRESVTTNDMEPDLDTSKTRYVFVYNAVLRIRGRPVAKCDPLPGRAIQHDPWSRLMGDLTVPTLDNWELDKIESMQILC